MNLDRMLDRSDLLRTIRGVAVELLVFHATNRPLDSICSHEHFIDLLSQVVVKPTPTGPTLEYPSEDVKRELLARFEGGSVEQQEASEAPANPTDMDFLDVSLADPAFKFAVCRVHPSLMSFLSSILADKTPPPVRQAYLPAHWPPHPRP